MSFIKNPVRWVKHKTWFLFDLPYFIREKNFKKGLELGAKAGRSMYYMLRANKQLQLTGIDLWEVIEGGAYKNNNNNERKCRKKLRKFKDRSILIKGNAFDLCDQLEDHFYDFIYYDLQCISMQGFHSSVLEKYLPKIKKGGVLIGRDFRDFRNDLYALDFQESDFKPCDFKNKTSQRLEYLEIK